MSWGGSVTVTGPADAAGERGEKLIPSGFSPTSTVATVRRRAARSSTETVPSYTLVTQARRPDGSNTTPSGPAPVGMLPVDVIRPVPIKEAEAPGLSSIPWSADSSVRVQ